MKKKLILLILILFLCSCGKEKIYYCINGELDGTECIITTLKDAEASCRKGYTKVGYVCKERRDAIANVKCDTGYHAESGTCVSDETVEFKKKYYCNEQLFSNIESVRLSGEECVYELCVAYMDNGACKTKVIANDQALETTDGCPSGSQEIYGVCRKVKQGKVTYTCDEGKLNGKYCILDNSTGVIYSCPEGQELVGYECQSEIRVPAKVKES